MSTPALLAFELCHANPPGAQSAQANARLTVELRKIRAVAAAAPFAAVVILELALQWLPGGIAGRTRFVLEGIVFVALAVYGAVMLGVTGTMRDRLKRQNRELLALHEAGLDVVSELSLEIVLKKVVDQARHLVGAKYGALSVVGDDGAVRSFVTSGITPEQREAIGPPPVGHGVLGVVLREGQRLRLEDIARHPRSVGFPAHHPMMKSLLAVPVTCKSPFLGNLYLAEKEGRQTFTSDEEETLERFAVQAALAIDNAYLHQQVGDLAVAQERLHIAHEMHDGIAQVLGYVNTKVQAANEYLRRGRSDEAAGQLRELASAAREAYSDVREAIVDLRTLPHPARAFADVLGEYVDRWEEQTGVSTHLSIDDDLALPAGIELQLIRIVQESLANVRKHAEAASVELAIHHRTGQLVLTVADDGLGFNPALRIPGQFPKFGLPTMRERAESIGGRLDIESAAGRGTIIRLEVPVPTE